MEVGGAFPGSARKALQMMPLFAVARTRAEPLDKDPTPKVPSTESPTAAPVPKRTVPPAATLSDVALGSLNAAPPGGHWLMSASPPLMACAYSRQLGSDGTHSVGPR